MSIDASYRGIQYKLIETDKGEWQWSFQPPAGPRQAGRVVGLPRYAMTVVRRAIDVWHLMNRGDRQVA
jgi:hypothetical protein